MKTIDREEKPKRTINLELKQNTKTRFKFTKTNSNKIRSY